MEIPINYLAVIAGAVANMIIGFMWFGPLFGKRWMTEAGWTPEAMAAAQGKSMTSTYALQMLGALVMSYVLAHAIIFGSAYTGTPGVIGGITASFWYWIGIVVPVSMGNVLWERKSWTYFAINAGYYLTVMLTMGAILGHWA